MEAHQLAEVAVKGINIFSGEKGLGSALTNPTELSFRKGTLQNHYPVHYRGMEYVDAETAYQRLKIGIEAVDNELMTQIIASKLDQHSRLLAEIKRRGGVAFLEVCSHFTHAKTESFAAWEGVGRQSRFIRNLIAGYMLAMSGKAPRQMAPEQKQLL